MCGSSHFSDATESLRENEVKKTRASIFKSQEVLQNNFILESLILAQDERWRRA